MSVDTLRRRFPQAKPWRWIIPVGLLALIAAWLASNGGLGMHGSVGLQNTSPTDSAQVQASAAEFPLTFISNAGQTDPAVRFHINAAEHTIFFSPY